MFNNTSKKFNDFVIKKGFPSLVRTAAPIGGGATVIPDYRAQYSDSRANVLYRGPSSESTDKSLIGSSAFDTFTQFEIPVDFGMSAIDTVRFVIKLRNISPSVNYLYPSQSWFRDFTINTPGNSSAILIQQATDTLAKYWSLNEDRAKIILEDGGFLSNDIGGGYETYDQTGPGNLDLYRGHPLISGIELQPNEEITISFHLIDTPITAVGFSPCFYNGNRLILQFNWREGAYWCSRGNSSIQVLDVRTDFYGVRYSEIEQAAVKASADSEVSLTIPYHMNTTFRRPLGDLIAGTTQEVVLTDLEGTYTAFNFWLSPANPSASSTPAGPNSQYFQNISPQVISWNLPADTVSILPPSVGENYLVTQVTFQPDGSSTYLGMNLNSETLRLLNYSAYGYHSYLSKYYPAFYCLPFSSNVYVDVAMSHIQSSGTMVLNANAKLLFVPSGNTVGTALYIHGYRVAMLVASRNNLVAVPV